MNENKLFSVAPHLSSRVDTSTHLFKGLDGYDAAEVWCGAISGENNSEDIANVDCVECLTKAAELGQQAGRQLLVMIKNQPMLDDVVLREIESLLNRTPKHLKPQQENQREK